MRPLMRALGNLVGVRWGGGQSGDRQTRWRGNAACLTAQVTSISGQVGCKRVQGRAGGPRGGGCPARVRGAGRGGQHSLRLAGCSPVGARDCCRVYGSFCFVVICTCVWSLLPAGESQESSSRAIILSGFGHLSPSRGYLSGASGPFSHLGCSNSLLTGVPASASAQPSTLKAAAFGTGQIVSSFAQNFQWLPSKSQGPQSDLQGPLSLLTHLPTFPDSLHRSCTDRLPISRVFAECSLCPEARPPALCKPPPSSSLGLCSNVTFSARPSQTACFLSPGSSFSPRHSHADTVCLLSVCLHTSLSAPRRWSFYSITFPGVDAEPGTVSSLRWLPSTVVSVSQGLLMLRTGVLTVFGSRHSLHWSRHGLLLFNYVVM